MPFLCIRYTGDRRYDLISPTNIWAEQELSMISVLYQKNQEVIRPFLFPARGIFPVFPGRAFVPALRQYCVLGLHHFRCSLSFLFLTRSLGVFVRFFPLAVFKSQCGALLP